MLVAQVSDRKLQLGGLLDRYKVNVDKYKEIIESFKQLDVNSKKFTDRATGKTNWDKVAESIEGCDEPPYPTSKHSKTEMVQSIISLRQWKD